MQDLRLILRLFSRGGFGFEYVYARSDLNEFNSMGRSNRRLCTMAAKSLSTNVMHLVNAKVGACQWWVLVMLLPHVPRRSGLNQYQHAIERFYFMCWWKLWSAVQPLNRCVKCYHAFTFAIFLVIYVTSLIVFNLNLYIRNKDGIHSHLYWIYLKLIYKQ